MRYDARAKLSVITNILHIIPTVFTDIQKNPELSPYKWMKYDSIEAIELAMRYIWNSDSCFAELKKQFIDRRIVVLKSAHNSTYDEIDKYINTTKSPKKVNRSENV